MKKLKKKHEKNLTDAIDVLNKTIDEIREYIPEANFYIAGSSSTSLNLHTIASPFCERGSQMMKWINSRVFSKDINHSDCGGY